MSRGQRNGSPRPLISVFWTGSLYLSQKKCKRRAHPTITATSTVSSVVRVTERTVTMPKSCEYTVWHMYYAELRKHTVQSNLTVVISLCCRFQQMNIPIFHSNKTVHLLYLSYMFRSLSGPSSRHCTELLKIKVKAFLFL